MENGLVSIIIPTYNAEMYIASTIDSVLSQTYKNWELIIVDDCSSDKTIQILESYKQMNEKIYWESLSKNSGGPSAPRNRGLRIAKGKYVAFLDSDDIWHHQKLELQLNCMKKEKIKFCFTDVKLFIDENKIIQKNFKVFPSVKFLSHNKLLKKNFIRSGSSVLCEKEIIGELFFNEEKKYIAIEDYLFWLYIHQKKIKYSGWIKEALVFYRLSDTSISSSKVEMIKKNLVLYSEYEIKGSKLGIKKYYYLFTYIYYSILNLIVYKIKLKMF